MNQTYGWNPDYLNAASPVLEYRINPCFTESFAAAQLSENLRRLILKLYADYLSDDGRVCTLAVKQ